jgi:hypothetical protein
VKQDEALKETGGVQPYVIYVGIAFYVLFIMTMIKMAQDGPLDGEQTPEKPAKPTAASSV